MRWNNSKVRVRYINNKKITRDDLSRRSLSPRKNFLLLHAKNKYKNWDIARDI